MTRTLAAAACCKCASRTRRTPGYAVDGLCGRCRANAAATARYSAVRKSLKLHGLTLEAGRMPPSEEAAHEERVLLYMERASNNQALFGAEERRRRLSKGA